MILELKVKNLVIIEEVNLSLEEGFNVFTGETGAGKSLLVQAIKLILGEKASPTLIKPGEKEAEVSAILWGGETLAKRLESLGHEPEEEIHIKRIISQKRQRTYLNGSPITLKELSLITKDLIVLTSQHEFYSLLSSESQLNYLDTFLKLLPLRREVEALYEELKNIKKHAEKLLGTSESLEVKKDFLRYQINELEALNPSVEEESELNLQRERLKNLAFLKESLVSLVESLNVSEEHIARASHLLEKLKTFEPSFERIANTFSEFYYELKEALREAESKLMELPEDESQLDEIEARLAKYEKLKKKYGVATTEELIEVWEKLKQELSEFESLEERLQELKQKEEKVKNEFLKKAKELSKKRKEEAKVLSDVITKELKDLGFEKSKFIVEVTPSKEPKETGIDEVKFLFAPNPGTPPRPLEKIASGGELSRVFLVCKSLLKGEEGVCFVFDEVDTGIGGITAKKLGAKLKTISESGQVICITHLPQIAALADAHFVVEKHILGDKTLTTVKKLSDEERLKEIARMLGEPENLSLAKEFLSSCEKDA